MDHGKHDRGPTGCGFSRSNVVLLAFIAIGGFYLLTEHRAHLFGWLPLLLLLACPLMHLFMHHGHGHGHGHGGGSGRSPGADKPDRDSDASAGHGG